jgi:hypothetical protein
MRVMLYREDRTDHRRAERGTAMQAGCAELGNKCQDDDHEQSVT